MYSGNCPRRYLCRCLKIQCRRTARYVLSLNVFGHNGHVEGESVLGKQAQLATLLQLLRKSALQLWLILTLCTNSEKWPAAYAELHLMHRTIGLIATTPHISPLGLGGTEIFLRDRGL